MTTVTEPTHSLPCKCGEDHKEWLCPRDKDLECPTCGEELLTRRDYDTCDNCGYHSER